MPFLGGHHSGVQVCPIYNERFCGYAGNCGGCVGVGITIALYLDSTPIRTLQRQAAHRTTIKALQLVDDGLIRCCKRSTFYGITTAIETLREDYDIDLGPIPVFGSCMYFDRNQDCARERCRYYPKE